MMTEITDLERQILYLLQRGPATAPRLLTRLNVHNTPRSPQALLNVMTREKTISLPTVYLALETLEETGRVMQHTEPRPAWMTGGQVWWMLREEP
jgi:Fe2+ or Zn2+ uptake regulation protein